MDFKNTVLIIDFQHRGVGTEAEVRQSLGLHFKPEFLNRIDDIVLFHSLGSEEIVRIIDIQLEILRQHLEEKKDDARLGPCRSRGALSGGI